MNIIELAGKAGLFSLLDQPSFEMVMSGEKTSLEKLERFAALVRADEREKVKKVLMTAHELSKPHHNYYHYIALQLDDAIEKIK